MIKFNYISKLGNKLVLIQNNTIFKIFTKGLRTNYNMNGANNKNNSKIYLLNSFANKSFSQNDEGIHPDFQPQVRQEINNDNVMSIIDDWVQNNEAVLFMKGTREMPRCGFSNYVVQIMNFYKIKNVKVVNILENPLIRESVKQYSNWPTYPQLYVKGNLIGGCDIIKEMHENGTLKDLVEREGLTTQ